MPNYSETKLYELISYDENGEPVVYRGHTTQPLHNRLCDHKSKFRAWLKDNTKEYCTSYEVLKHEPARIELVRTVCCNDVMEAKRAEGIFIRESPCVNKRIAGRTQKESQKAYNEANKDAIRAQVKAYCKANKDAIRERNKAYHKANKDVVNEKQRVYYQWKCVERFIWS